MRTDTVVLVDSAAEAQPEWSTLVELLRWRSQHQPDRLAYTFLSDGATEESSLTYSELDQNARAVAAWLQSQTTRGERVLLLYPPGLEYITAFFGCLYAGVVAVPAYPPRNNRNLLRLQSLIDDAKPAFALTTPFILSRLTSFAGNAALAKIRWLTSQPVSEQWQEPLLNTDDLAIMQYTSGSTSVPKGVMLTHSNFLHNDRLLQKAFGQTEQSVIVSWLPLYHDMGLTGVVIHSLSVGARCILMSPVSFLQQPFSWLWAISRYRATTSGGPNFSYDLCVRKITGEQRAQLDLSSWTVAFNGAEPVRPETMDRFAKAFAPCGFKREAFRPCYGLAEATLLVSAQLEAGPIIKVVSKKALEQNQIVEVVNDSSETRKVVSCGHALGKVLIVDPESLTPNDEDTVGEIWVSGPSVAAGYWNKPVETATTFRAVPTGVGAGSFLRTGDLGFLQDGELFLTGRLKDLIVTRGRNHYPQDIELTVEQCHPSLRSGCGAAFSVLVHDEEQVVVVQETEARQPVEAGALIGSIREAITDQHEIAAHAVVLIRAGTIPKTSSGKIQRKACRQLFLEGGLKVVAEWREGFVENGGDIESSQVEETPDLHEREKLLRPQLAELLRIEQSQINVHESLLRYGLDSLLATELTHRIETSFGVVVPLTTLLDNPTIASIAEIIEKRGTLPSLAATSGESASEYPLSFGQQSLWFLHRIAPDSGAYNLATALRLSGELDAAALHRAFEALVQRHGVLRSTFSQDGDAPVQRVRRDLPLSFEHLEASSWNEATVDEHLTLQAQRPFNLSDGPPLRVTLLHRSDREHLLLLVVHHIVADFWSLTILMKELGVIYDAERQCRRASLPALTMQYADHVREERAKLDGTRGEELWNYWSEQLGAELPSLNLQIDRPRPAVQTFRGSAKSFRIDAILTAKLKQLARSEGTTLYMVLLTAFQTLLYRYSGQRKFVIGSPTAARDSARLAGIVGYFVNPLPLLADLSGDPSFLQLLARVQRTVLNAFAHQDFPFALLVERLRPERDASRSPLFQHMFVMQQSDSIGAGQLATNLRLEPFALEQSFSLFDLRLSLAESGDTLAGSMEYSTDLFEATTIERMLGHFQTLLEGIVIDPRQSVRDFTLLTGTEKDQVLAWNETSVDYGPATTLDQLVTEQVSRTPNNVAVIFEQERLTYAELDRRATALATELRQRGVGPDVLVGVCMERSVELVVALLAVLKAGGAYVPLDPGYPRERLQFMIEDAKPAVILTTDSIDQSHGSDPDSIRRFDQCHPSNLAYVIYTSGSTGRPKGAMNTHSGIVNRLRWMQAQFRLTESDCVLQKTPFSFDVSVWEFFWPLITGARLVLARPGGHQDPIYLSQLIAHEQVTTLHFVPSMLQTFLTIAELDHCASLKRVICSGEALSYELKEHFHAALDAELYNLYGPTEASVDVTYWACERHDKRQSVPIGRPIANTEIYILDSGNQPTAVGIAGELLIGGIGLGRGYLNRPDLTAERFQPHPFAKEPDARLYRSGDLARYDSSGQIEYLGRLDQQVKLRGFRIELGEIEAVLRKHTGVRECVVTVSEIAPGDMRLVAYVLPASKPVMPEEIREHLKERLPEYMVPSLFVNIDTIPRLPNGKIDRNNLPAASVEQTTATVSPRNHIEAEVATIWSSVLGLETLGVHENFFALGGHSLLATQIVARINRLFHIDIPLREMFEAPTVAGLAKVIARNPGRAAQLQLVKRTRQVDHLPLSFAQQRLWFLDQLEPGNAAYIMPILLRIAGALDLAVLRRCVEEIIHRHEILRTTIIKSDGNPVQVIAPCEEWHLPVVDLSGLPGQYAVAEAMRRAREEAQRPFDLAHGPLLRVIVWHLKPNDHLLLIATHHVVSDGWSLNVFNAELSKLYKSFTTGQASPLAELPFQYADFAQWQREYLAIEAAEQLAYWKRQLSERLPVLVSPSERSRRTLPESRVGVATWTMPSELTKQLEHFSRQNDTTLFMTLLTAFQILLHRYTGLDDIVVGTPVAGRTRVELESLIGLFVNTLVLRSDLSGSPTFLELLGRVREMTLEAHVYQHVPFEMLVEELQPERDLSHTPLFQVMIVLDAPLAEIDLPGLQVQQLELAPTAPKFDLILFLRQRGEELIASWEYSTTRLDSETVSRMADHYVTLLRNVISDPEQSIADVAFLTEPERRRLLVEWNDTNAHYEQQLCLHELFETQAALTPDAIALISGGEQVSYRELNARANRLAHHLRRLGAGAESLVGVMMERSTSLVVSLLGVLKAGSAYVPLDPTYPRERLRLMLEDAGVEILLTQQSLRADLPRHDARVIFVDADWEHIAAESSENPASVTLSANLAYLIYTSGSSGKPKGAAVEHKSVVTLMHWARNFFTQNELKGVLASTSVCFDLSVFEIFVPLTTGGKVILAANALELATLEAAEEVTLINTVPSAMAELIRLGAVPPSVRVVNLAGEPLPKTLAHRVYEIPGVERLLNLYGPSEDTTYSTWALIERGDPHAPTIGRPIANTQVYLLDARQQPVPIGVIAELYLSGDGLVRGYLNNPALTAEKFVPNPFSSELGARMYRTGDLARYLSDGRIEYLGRTDHQVKLRGFRIELGEIATILGEYPGVQDAVVVMDENGEAKNLAAYFVTTPEDIVTQKELRDFLLERLPKHMVPAFFIQLSKLPLTPNGKIDRKALPTPEVTEIERHSTALWPRSQAEVAIANLWSRLLNRNDISIHDDFFALGGHSLLATQLVSRLRDQFRVELPLQSIFETPTIAALAALIEETKASSSPIPRVARAGNLPVSFAQQRLWFLDQLAPGNYNIIGGMRLRGALDQAAFAQAFNAIIQRHEILRTSFSSVDGRPVQIIAASGSIDVSFTDLSSLAELERETAVRELAETELVYSFDLTSSPLLRVTVVRLSDQEHVALITTHHIIADGWSMNVFVKELVAFYEHFRSGGPLTLAPLPVQFADYAYWQREWLSDEMLRDQLDYWKQKVSGPLPSLKLPVDHHVESEPAMRALKFNQKFPAELSEALRELSQSKRVTLFMTLLAAFAALLHRYTNEDDLIIGSVIAGRNRREVEDLIGNFINMLVLRTDLSGNPTFSELLNRVREVSLAAYAHQDVPFERLVEELQPVRANSRSPFFQVAFGLQQQPLQTFTLPDLELTPFTFDSDVSRYDLTLWIFDDGRDLNASWTFSTDLFKTETIRLMHLRFETLLSSIVKTPEARIATLDMLSEEEKQQITLREQESINKLLSVKQRRAFTV